MTLRDSTEALREITRSQTGAATTPPPGGYVGGRIITDFLDQIDVAPFEGFEQIYSLRQFIHAALGADFANYREAYTMLFEAESREIVQAWHRDYRDNVPDMDITRWRESLSDLSMYVQFNTALCHDLSLWIVPGSHCREDTPDEARFIGRCPAVFAPRWDQGRSTVADFARAGAEYLRATSGAANVILAPGDIVMYRNCAIHAGYYVPTVKRATLRGQIESPATARVFVDTLIAPEESANRRSNSQG